MFAAPEIGQAMAEDLEQLTNDPLYRFAIDAMHTHRFDHCGGDSRPQGAVSRWAFRGPEPAQRTCVTSACHNVKRPVLLAEKGVVNKLEVVYAHDPDLILAGSERYTRRQERRLGRASWVFGVEAEG